MNIKPLPNTIVRATAMTLALIASLFWGERSHAAVVENQQFHFGNVVVTDNSGQHNITVNTDGTYSMDAEFLEISGPQPGNYTFTSVPNNAAVLGTSYVVIQDLQSPGSEDFIIQNIVIDAPASSTGTNITFDVGGTISTSGTGIAYGADATFSGRVEITLSF